jgi:hypothetical protein
MLSDSVLKMLQKDKGGFLYRVAVKQSCYFTLTPDTLESRSLNHSGPQFPHLKNEGSGLS